MAVEGTESEGEGEGKDQDQDQKLKSTARISGKERIQRGATQFAIWGEKIDPTVWPAGGIQNRSVI